MKNGTFIVLYGINNLGKSTQANLLVERMNKEGLRAEYLKYPIYDLEPSGPLINAYLREGNPQDLSPEDAQTLYTENRTQYEPTLKEKLASGINIVAEDYVGTGLAWGIGAGVEEVFMKNMNKHLHTEDLAFLFEGNRFVDATETDHKHETNEALLAKVSTAHKKLGAEYDWIPVNANQTIEEIHEFLWKTVKNVIHN